MHLDARLVVDNRLYLEVDDAGADLLDLGGNCAIMINYHIYQYVGYCRVLVWFS